MSDREELARLLGEIETACEAYDGGDVAAAARAAAALRSVFHQGAGSAPAPLLSRLSGTYTKLASSVARPPYPPGLYSPLVEIELDLGLATQHVVSTSGNSGGVGPPRFRPRLGRAEKFRQVQAPDWWKSEPAFLVDHSKATRRDVVVWAAGEGPGSVDEEASPLFSLLVKARLTGLRGLAQGGFLRLVPVREAHAAAVRQTAHEVLNSPGLRKLAS